MPALELFTGTHYDEMFRTFLKAYNTYFKLTGISDNNIKALLAKNRLSDTACTWYDSQDYDETMVTFATMKSNI